MPMTDGLTHTGPRANARIRAVFEANRRKLYVQQCFPYSGWYAFVVMSGHEQDAADGFRREQLRVYWPNEIKLTASGRGRRREMLKAIIPGLLFTPVADLDLLWDVAERICYVRNVVRKNDGTPAILANEDVEIIRHIEAGLNLPPPIIPIHTFKIGEKVRFTDDILGRWDVCKIISLQKDHRISVERYLMGRMIPIHGVLPHQIERCN